MAIDGARELSAELSAIKKGEARGLYRVFGTEGYLVRTASEAIAKALAEASGAEIVHLDASGQAPEVVLEPVTSLSLFSPARITVVRGFAHLLVGKAADRLLAGVEPGVGAGSALVFVAPALPGEKIDKRVKGYKGLARLGATLELNTQKPEELTAWLVQKAADEGKKLAPDAAMLLLQRVGADMELLRSELDKAILFCFDQHEITARNLENLVGKSREDAVWDITETVARRDSARAMELIDDLLTAGTYPLVLMTLLARQARHMLQARLLWESAGKPAFRDIRGFQRKVATTYESGVYGRGADDVTTIHPFATFKRFEAVREKEVGELRRQLSRMRRADREAKTGESAGAREVLEELVLDLCSRSREVVRA
jgi:DNA polymerase-3 subunit delta